MRIKKAEAMILADALEQYKFSTSNNERIQSKEEAIKIAKSLNTLQERLSNYSEDSRTTADFWTRLRKYCGCSLY